MATIWLGHLCLVGALPSLLPQRSMDDLAEAGLASALGGLIGISLLY
jgi:hypothetical protein